MITHTKRMCVVNAFGFFLSSPKNLVLPKEQIHPVYLPHVFSIIYKRLPRSSPVAFLEGSNPIQGPGAVAQWARALSIGCSRPRFGLWHHMVPEHIWDGNDPYASWRVAQKQNKGQYFLDSTILKPPPSKYQGFLGIKATFRCMFGGWIFSVIFRVFIFVLLTTELYFWPLSIIIFPS